MTRFLNDGAPQRLYNWKPVLGTKLLGIRIGRGLGAPKGLRSIFHSVYTYDSSFTFLRKSFWDMS